MAATAGRLAVPGAAALFLAAALATVAWRAIAGPDLARLRGDLRDVAAAQQAYFAQHGRFTAALSETAARLRDGVTPVRVRITGTEVTIEMAAPGPRGGRCRIVVRPDGADRPACGP